MDKETTIAAPLSTIMGHERVAEREQRWYPPTPDI